jgi:hypothetical protein
MDRLTLRVAARHRLFVAFGISDLKKLMSKATTFGVISAYNGEKNFPKSVNKQRHGTLVQKLQKMGFSNFETLTGSWGGIKEIAILVPRIPFSKLMGLGQEFGQDAVVYKDPSGTIGIYDKHGDAQLAYDPSGDAAVSMSLGQDDFSKGRSMSFGLQLMDQKFKFHGQPITRDKLLKELQHGA